MYIYVYLCVYIVKFKIFYGNKFYNVFFKIGKIKLYFVLYIE